MLIFGCFVLARQYIMPFYLSDNGQTMNFMLSVIGQHRTHLLNFIHLRVITVLLCIIGGIGIIFIRKIDIGIFKKKGIRFVCCMMPF